MVSDLNREIIRNEDNEGNEDNENNNESDFWSLNDLVNRYGVSRSKITGDFFSLGLPFKKVGRAYHFTPENVVEWEIDQKYIPYRKNRRILLPAYIEYRERLKAEIKQAKKMGDKERVRALKQEAKSRNIPLINDGMVRVLAVVFIALILILLKAIGLL